jgi:tetratricopeptide (TPR) repeat protein
MYSTQHGGQGTKTEPPATGVRRRIHHALANPGSLCEHRPSPGDHAVSGFVQWSSRKDEGFDKMNSLRRHAGIAAHGFALLLCGGMVLPAQMAVQNPELAAALARGHAALQANNQALATQQFQAALQRDPNNVDAHANLGVMAFFHGDCPAAETELQSALRGDPALTKAQALLAICERRLGQPSALADMQNAFDHLQDPKLRTMVGVQLADFYFQQGDLDHTLPVVHALVEAEPENVDLLFFAQRVYAELADNTMNKLALLAPDSARMQQLIAEQLIHGGDLKGAIEHYRKAIAADPRLPGMHFELAEALLDSSPTAAAQAEARQELEAAVKTDGDSAKVECALGRLAGLQSNSDAAYAHYRRAYQMDEHEVEAQLGLSAMLVEEGKTEEALPYLRLAVKTDPLNANAHYRLARACHTLHLNEEEKKEIQLYQEIRKTKDRVVQLYRQMNRRPAAQDDAPPEDKP